MSTLIAQGNTYLGYIWVDFAMQVIKSSNFTTPKNALGRKS